MGRLVQSEWTKLLTTRVWIGLLAGACLLGGGFAALLTAFAGNADSGLPPVGTAEFEKLAFAVASNGTVLTMVLGIIGMRTGRHRRPKGRDAQRHYQESRGRHQLPPGVRRVGDRRDQNP